MFTLIRGAEIISDTLTSRLIAAGILALLAGTGALLLYFEKRKAKKRQEAGKQE
ncbi:MAG: hypothetical protein ACOX17_02230 [Christensenellales bacterium]|jgi:hypothetical protein